MRNLKKVLSLVLALAMVLSICMVGAGAVNYDDFTDEESITKKQAVETLVSLDVINGYNDGAEFRPTGNVTRAEMATMICRVLAGGDNMIPNAVKEVPTYNDIRNNPSAAWAETYIEYCTSLGIVSGKGNGIFDPMADVTAAEAAKMVMTTLGYNADIEGFKGIGWDINTMAKASTLKLTDNLVGEISANQPMTREQVAQMLFNALDDPMVQYYEGSNANVWIGAGNVNNKYYETLLEAKFHAEKLTGVVEANEWADLYAETGIRKGTTRLALMDNGGDLTGETRVVEVSTDLMDIGQSVIVYWNKDTKRVLYGNTQDTGLNVISEIKTGYENIARGDNAVSGALTKDTQYFVNYDNNYAVDHESDYLIRYTAGEIYQLFDKEEDAKALKAELDAISGMHADPIVKEGDKYKVTWHPQRTIRPGDPITATDLDNIYLIFSTADKWSEVDNGVPVYVYDAEVYVGTQSLDDISDTMSYKEFLRRYVTDEDNVLTRDGFTESGYDANGARDLKNDNENGNYIRAIDFNNDGDIDYVLKIEFEMHEVANVGRNDVTLGKDKVNNSDLITSEELTKGDVVITTEIDGITYADMAPTFEGEVDSYNMRRDILTVDGTEYGQSAVLEDTQYPNLIAYAEKDVNYTYYQDHFGYIRIFAYPSDAENNYVLLTDGWFREKIDENEYAVKAYVDGEIKTFYTTSRTRAGHPFIDDSSNGSKNNSWGMLYGFNDYERNDAGYPKYPTTASQPVTAANGAQAQDTDGLAITNVAAYTLNDDDVMSLKDVKTWNYNKQHDKEEVDANYVNLVSAGKGLTSGQTEYTGYYIADDKVNDRDIVPGTDIRVDASKWNNTTNAWSTVTVQATRDTVFYYVTRVYDSRLGYDVVDSVRTVTGYRNALNVAANEIEAMYAVATNTLQSAGQSREYWVADVIVVEVNGLTAEAKNAFFNIYANEKNKDEIATGDVILDTAATGTLTMRMGKTMDDFDKYTDNGTRLPLGFYTKTDPDKDGVVTVNLLTAYAKYGIYAAEVDRVTNLINYLTTEVDGRTKTFEYNKDEVTVYTLEGRDDDRYDDIKVDVKTRDAEGNKIAVDPGDKVIAVCNKNDVLYIIDVTKSDLPNNVQTSEGKGLMTLWTAIEKANQDTSGTGDKVSKIEAAEKALKAYQDNTDPAKQTALLAALMNAYNEIKDMTVDGLTTAQANRLGTVRGTIEGLIGDEITADVLTNDLVDKCNKWVNTPATPEDAKQAAADAMFKSAAAYKEAGVSTTGGTAALAKATAEADRVIGLYNSNMTAAGGKYTFAGIVTASGLHITEDMLSVATTSVTDAYDIAKDAFDTYEPLYQKAKALVDAWYTAQTVIGASYDDVYTALDAISNVDEALILGDISDSGQNTDYDFGHPDGYDFTAVLTAAKAHRAANEQIPGSIEKLNLNPAMAKEWNATIGEIGLNDDGQKEVVITLGKKGFVEGVQGSDAITDIANWIGIQIDGKGEGYGNGFVGTGELRAYYEAHGSATAGLIVLTAEGKNAADDIVLIRFKYADTAKDTYTATIQSADAASGNVVVEVSCDTDVTSTAEVSVSLSITNTIATITKTGTGTMSGGTVTIRIDCGNIKEDNIVKGTVTVDGQTIDLEDYIVTAT